MKKPILSDLQETNYLAPAQASDIVGNASMSMLSKSNTFRAHRNWLVDNSADIRYTTSIMIEKGKQMTNFEKNCYGMTEADIREQYLNSLTAKLSGTEMLVAGILSDCQEMLEMGYDKDQIRKQLNIAKFCLFENQKESV